MPSNLTIDDFPEFFQAIWGYEPFGWQPRLLAQVREQGWPSTLDLPTGSGKTSALDVALFALALDAFEPAERRRQPRRTALVVDRRTVVDQAYDRAVRLAEELYQAREGVVARVAEALRALQKDEDPFPVVPAILRGGMPRESDWARTPHQPVLLVSTVDQVGSRLLFRGYGVSDSMRPVHAGLLGRDTLFLLDEVHLSQPFEQTLAELRERARSERLERTLPRPLEVVRMSATAANRGSEPFSLEESERTPCSDPPQCDPRCPRCVLATRLRASKRAALRQVKTPKDPVRAGETMAKACAREARRLTKADGIRAVAVIVNRVETARQVANLAVGTLPEEWDVQLVTGRMRPLDRAELQNTLLDDIKAGRTRSSDSARVLLVATQAVEAGADFDFDAVVTEHASLDALRQRFGRLDRLGELERTDAIVLAASRDVGEDADPDPIYRHALHATWQWLHERPEHSEQHDAPVVDFGIDAMESRLANTPVETLVDLLPPRPVAPILTPSHLDRWVQTAPAPSADPDVSAFLHGPERGPPDVQVVWRADLSTEELTPARRDQVHDMLGIVPPSALEALSVPIWAAQGWLATVAGRQHQDGEQAPESASATAYVSDVEGGLESEREPPNTIAPVVRWRGDDGEVVSRPGDVRPGDVLVVPSSYGGLDARFGCWDPSATEPVRDRGDEAQLFHRARAVLRWSPAVLKSAGLGEPYCEGPKLDQADLDERGAEAEREAFHDWSEALLADESTPEWMKLTLSMLRQRGRVLSVGSRASGTNKAPTEAWRASWRRRRICSNKVRELSDIPSLSGFHATADATPTTEDDSGSFTGVEHGVPLARHLQGTREFAERFASALDLPPEVANDVELAAWIHDLGKADPRFQMLLHGGDPVKLAVADEPIAKSDLPASDRSARERARRRSGYPSGMRHELMSLALAAQSDALKERAHDWDLVLHLVASHHGWCRPFAPPVPDPDPVEVQAELQEMSFSASSDHGLARVDSGVTDRFWSLVRTYGYWGLAWLEGIVRLADHRESEKEASNG